MPTSHFNQINEIMTIIDRVGPKKVLDIGPGFGKYGVLMREMLEFTNPEKNYLEREIQIDCIEIFEEYLTNLHRYIYDNIYIGNAVELVPDLKTIYDLVILIDIIEHLEYNEGKRLIESCLSISKNVLISTPRINPPQGIEFGNINETHRFQWKKKHFEQFDQSLYFFPNWYSIICLMGESANSVKNKLWKISLITRIYNFPFKFMMLVKQLFKPESARVRIYK
jgi:hypothetical protein